MRFLNIVIFLFTLCITLTFLFLILLWIYIDYENIPNLVRNPKKEYDYIIIGSGTAGSTLAWALSKQSNCSILLIEAGTKFNLLSKIPIASISLQGNERTDWKFKTVPQQWSSKGFINQQQKWPRGKGIGGSAQINYMLHFGGVRKDFDELELYGGQNWSFQKLKKFLSMPLDYEPDQMCYKIEGQNFCSETPNEFFKISFREIPITKIDPIKSKLTEAFLESANDLSQSVRFKASEYYTKNGYRHSTYHTYLKPSFYHTNLQILTETIAMKIIFDNGNNATGVLVSRDYENPFEIKANKEILLCTGAVQTPQLLKVSGIGPKNELESHNIKVIAINYFVGKNLYDHFNMPLFVTVNSSLTVNLKKLLSLDSILEYIQNGTGVYSNMAIYGQGSALNRNYGMLLFAMGSADEKVLRDVSNLNSETFKKFFPFHYNHSEEGFVALSTCHKPKSRGQISISGNSIYDEPLIDPRYLESHEDVKCMLDAVKLSFEVVQSRALQKLGAKIHWPLINECITTENLKHDMLPSDEYLECVLRYGALTAHHPGGSCSFGLNESAVDETLRVRGVNRLRVVDASVIPVPVSGTPNYIISVIAKRAADLILNET
uniref:CSON001339 protein n=1 Tax=Culicoides sonorensis TaxID=179676 RepID=A0A336LIB5_CULSO